ncbi:MAG TPA: aldose 1-epimerase, partial [Pirellulales bacterium]|nr:aldose 1-epimerase [Pirellulales bacterium]
EAKLLEHWPADFRIVADYQVSGGALIAEYTIENPDTKPLVFGFGTHPYFWIPPGGTSADDCRVTVPVEYDWQLEGLLPTGKRTTSPVAAELARGMLAGGMHLDHVFGGLKFENHRTRSTIQDPASKHTLTLDFDDQFPTVVVYNPPHREAVCIEPYTTLPDPFTLQQQGIDPHLQTLAPGKSFRTRIEIRIA